MKPNVLLIATIFTVIVSCSKEECKQCYLEETNSITGKVVKTSLGEKCGDEIEDINGKTYVGSNGPARSFCE